MASESLLSSAVFRHFCGISGINDLESRSEVIQGHRFWYQWKARTHIPISGQ